MDLADVADRYDEHLRTDAYADLDASANGVQVGVQEEETEHVAFAVDAVEATATAAVEAGADLLVTHHGVIWGGLDRLTGQSFGRIAPLVRNDVGLYVSHLPLDGHQELGNAAGLADSLGLESRDPFGDLGGEPLGVRGRFPEPRSAVDIRADLDTLDQGDADTRVLDHGPDAIEDVAVLTGSGADWFGEAVAADVDAFVTGEGKGKLYHEAREAGVTVFLAGHYATETFGVRALADLAAEWGLETTYIDHPTGL
jgi:dinuclear metal center YbgI/SA1388 family protein